MCTHCDKIILKKRFCNPSDYENTLQSIQELIAIKEYTLVEATCDIGDVRSKDGK